MKFSSLTIISVLWLALMPQLALAENSVRPENDANSAEAIIYQAPSYAWLTHTRRGNRMFRVNCEFVTHYLFDNNLQAFYNNGKQLNEREFCARNR